MYQFFDLLVLRFLHWTSKYAYSIQSSEGVDLLPFLYNSPPMNFVCIWSFEYNISAYFYCIMKPPCQSPWEALTKLCHPCNYFLKVNKNSKGNSKKNVDNYPFLYIHILMKINLIIITLFRSIIVLCKIISWNMPHIWLNMENIMWNIVSLTKNCFGSE